MPSPVAGEHHDDGLLRRTLRRLTASEHDLHAADLVEQIGSAGASPCREMPGIEPRRTLVARRRIASDGFRRVIVNPWYELRPAVA